MQQQQQQPQVQVIMQPQSNQDGSPPKLNKKRQRIVGYIQIGLGLASFVLGVAYIGVKNAVGLHFIGTGIWCGIFVIIAGVLGVVSAKTGTTGTIVGCMVMSILASISGVCMFALSAGMCGSDNEALHHVNPYVKPLPHRQAAVAVGALGVFVGVAIVAVAIVQSCVCCHATCRCCNGSSTAPIVIFVQQPYPGHPGYSGQVQGFAGTVTPATGQAMQPPPYTKDKGSDLPPAYQGQALSAVTPQQLGGGFRPVNNNQRRPSHLNSAAGLAESLGALGSLA